MLVYSETKAPVGKLPIDVRGFKLLRYTRPSRARPSGELILKQLASGELMRSAPPVFGMMVVGE